MSHRLTPVGAVAHGSATSDERFVPLRSPTGYALIAATVLASTIGYLDASVVNVAVPAIGADLHGSVSAQEWTVTSYLVTVAALLLVAGSVADRFGRRRTLAAGLLITLATSVLCAAAPTIAVLLIARVLQGFGDALVVPSSLALLNGTLPPQDRARAIGLWAGLSTLGTTVGPYAGGWLVDHGSWRWLFLLNGPLIVAGLLALRLVPESGRPDVRSAPDLVGSLLAAVGLGGLIFALTEGTAHGWSSAPVLLASAAAVVCLAALVPVERRLAAPMLRLSLFSSRQFDAINSVTVLFYGALAASGFLFTLQCELRLGYSAAAAGAALIPSSVLFLIVSAVSGTLVGRFGPRWLMTAGPLAVAGSLLWLSAASPGAHYPIDILPAAVLQGLGLGLTVAPLTASVLAAVPALDLAEASAVNNAAARLGGVVAIAALPAVAGMSGGRSLAETLRHGYQPAMLIAAGLSVAAAAIAAAYVSDDRVRAPRLAPPPPYGCAPAIPTESW
jgi:EmrB/QacA subfamily drug resistance transporter